MKQRHCRSEGHVAGRPEPASDRLCVCSTGWSVSSSTTTWSCVTSEPPPTPTPCEPSAGTGRRASIRRSRTSAWSWWSTFSGEVVERHFRGSLLGIATCQNKQSWIELSVIYRSFQPLFRKYARYMKHNAMRRVSAFCDVKKGTDLCQWRDGTNPHRPENAP